MFIKDYLHQIEAAAFTVYCQLGRGQKQATYKEALITEFTQRGLPMTDTNDICINETVIVEVFATPKLKTFVEDKFTNRLTLTNTELGYIVNFGLGTQVLRKFKRDRVI